MNYIKKNLPFNRKTEQQKMIEEKNELGKKLVQGLETAMKGFLKPTDDNSKQLIQGLETAMKGVLKPTDDNSKQTNDNSKQTNDNSNYTITSRVNNINSRQQQQYSSILESTKQREYENNKIIGYIKSKIDSLNDIEIIETTKYNGKEIKTKSCVTKYGEKINCSKLIENNNMTFSPDDNSIVTEIRRQIENLLNKVDEIKPISVSPVNLNQKKTVNDIINENQKEIDNTINLIFNNINSVNPDSQPEVIQNLKATLDEKVNITDETNKQKYDILTHIIKSVLNKLLSKSL